MNIDSLSASAHKFHGPKGIGILYMKKGIKFNPLIAGGHQEKSKRAGTENVASIVGLGEALKISYENLEEKNKKIKELRDYYFKEVEKRIPYIKIDVPIAILFRALGVTSDKDIMDYIVFDEDDNSFKELLRPSLDYSIDYKEKEECLEFIGNKATKGEEKSRRDRIKRAEEILRKEMLPHVSIEKGNEVKKAYFIGYMIYRLGNCALGRAYGDDRDHYGKKRLDMSGVLLCGIFRQLFRRFTKKTETVLKDSLKRAKSRTIQLENIIDKKMISHIFRERTWGVNENRPH